MVRPTSPQPPKRQSRSEGPGSRYIYGVEAAWWQGGAVAVVDDKRLWMAFRQRQTGLSEVQLIVVEDVLGRDETFAIREALDRAPFRDGAFTAGAAARKVKRNEQARGDDPGVVAVSQRVRLALESHDVMRRLVRPVRWSNLLFSRYGPGQQYGLHADNAVMTDADGWPFRTDISFTLFLSDPETYDGGGLLIADSAGDREFRPAAGCAVFYPTGLLHRVMPITSGVRLACVGWVQSSVRRPDQREILFDLERLRDGVTDEASLILDKTIGNLLRMWVGE